MPVTYRPLFARFVDSMVHQLDPMKALDIGPFIGATDLGVGGHGCMLVGISDFEDRFHVMYEFSDNGRGLLGLLEQIDAIGYLRNLKINIGHDGLSRSVLTGDTAAAMIEARGHSARVVRSSPRLGLSRVRSLISEMPGQSQITIEPRCWRLISDLRLYAVKRCDDRGVECATLEASHTVDALRYMVDPALNLGGW